MKKAFLISVFILLWAYASEVDMSLFAQTPNTQQTYKDTDNKVYQVHVGKKGRMYIVRTSKSGKTYKKYIKKL